MPKASVSEETKRITRKLMERVPWNPAAQDHKGHSARIDFRVPPPVKRMLKIALEKYGETVGWQTDSDLCRWVMNFGLHVMAEDLQDMELSNYDRQVAAVNKIVESATKMAAFGASIDEAERLVKGMFDKNLDEAAVELLYSVRREIYLMDNMEWRDAWEDEFNRRLAPMLPKTLSLKPENWTDPAIEEQRTARDKQRKKAKRARG
jgi:hypothetical protein